MTKIKNTNIIPFYDSSDIKIEKAKGSYLFDNKGKKYIDFESGVWCTNIGQSNSFINGIIERQIKNNVHHGYKFWNRHAVSLSNKLLEISGLGNGQSVFLSSGSEAIELSISLAKHLTKRNKILKIESSYLSAYGNGKESPDNDALVRINIDDADSVNLIKFDDIACFVLEVGGASFDMVRFPSESFIINLINQLKRNNCIIISDEVTTGIARTGKWFGYQQYNLLPDIIVTGKGLGNGYPLSAVTISSKIAEEFQKYPFRYAQSHQNDPLGCAIGLGVIKYIEDNRLLDRCQDIGKYFKDELLTLKNLFPEKVKEIRGRGLILAIEFSSDVNFNNLCDHLLRNNFVVGCKNNSIRFLPPITIQKTDIIKLIMSIKLFLAGSHKID